MDSPFEGINKKCSSPRKSSYFACRSIPTPTGEVESSILEDAIYVVVAIFHSENGAVPLVRRSFVFGESRVTENTEMGPPFDPIAGKAATITLSPLWSGGHFGFDSFSKKLNERNKRASNCEPISRNGGNMTSYCPVGSATSSVAKFTGYSPCLKLRCPRAVVAVQAGHSHTEPGENLEPQPMPSKILAIALVDMAAKLLLGVLREHATQFSLPWFEAIHVAMQFIVKLMQLYPGLMPNTAMTFILAAFILGLVIALRAEQNADAVTDETMAVKNKGDNEVDLRIGANGLKMPNVLGNRGKVISMKIENSTVINISNSNINTSNTFWNGVFDNFVV